MWQAVLLASRVLAIQGRDEAAAVLLLAVVDRPNLIGGAAGLSVEDLQENLRERLGDDELHQIRGRVRFLTDTQIVTCATGSWRACSGAEPRGRVGAPKSRGSPHAGPRLGR